MYQRRVILPKQYLSVVKYRGSICSKEINQETKQREFKVFKDYPFRFFTPSKDTKETGYKDIKGHPLKEMTADSIKEFQNKTKAVLEYGHKLYGTSKLEYQYIYEEFKDSPRNDLVIPGFFDIETAKDPVTGYSTAREALNPIISISFVYKDKIHFWATKDLPDSFCQEFNIDFHWFMTEKEMLLDFMKLVRTGDVDILSGWNIETYDIPYTINRVSNLGLDPNLLSPFKKIQERNIRDKFGNEQQTFNIIGIQILDYLSLYKKFTYVTRDNYTLNNIAYCELKETKEDYSEMIDLDDLYERDFIKFAKYNVKDSLLVKRLDDKLKLIDLCVNIAYKAGVNFQDALGTVKMWTFYAYRALMNNYTVPPMVNNIDDGDDSSIIGGYVKDPQLGFHSWIVTFDLASLYPHNQMGANISPDKILEDDELPQDLLDLRESISRASGFKVENTVEMLSRKEFDLSLLKKYDVCMTPNLQFFKRDSLGFMPAILKDIYSERSIRKKEELRLKQEEENDKTLNHKNEISRLHNIQLGLKIMMNSEYGALANSAFIFYDSRTAEAITSIGQVAITFIARKFNEYFASMGINEEVVSASDTDSVFLRFGPIVRKFFPNKSNDEVCSLLDKISEEKIQPFINKSYSELADYLNCYAMEWKMKREKIASNTVIVAKKRYFMAVMDDEGVRMKEPKLKVTGLDAVRSSTPEICREAFKKAMKIILEKTEEDLQEFILSFEKEFNSAHVLDIAMPRSVSDIEKYLDSQGRMMKGIPIAVRGSVVFNKKIKEVDPTFPLIKSGDKVKFFYLKLPNTFQSNIISLPNRLPESLKLSESVIDRKTQFEKTFRHPLMIILDIIKWKPEKINDLLSFF
jgi:DNA polymerase elongation subunit (family B)